MGGNIFKDDSGIPLTIRIDRDQYYNALCDIAQIFLVATDNASWFPVRSYTTKDSFGDIDIVSDIQHKDSLVKYLENERFKYSINSNVVSFMLYVPKPFEKRGFVQVDAIFHEKEDIQCALGYYANNDLGNLIGRLAHRLGLKYGHDGLSYIHRDGDQVLFKLNLSKDTAAIYEFLGLKFKTTFDTIEDIFEFVSSSKYFHPNIYLLENRNHISRVRDRKRKTYNEFLQYCQNNFKDLVNEPAPVIDKSISVSNAIAFFKRTDELNALMDIVHKNKVFKAKLNGDIIGDVTGLSGKELGQFMAYIKPLMPVQLVNKISDDLVVFIIKELYESFKGKDNE